METKQVISLLKEKNIRIVDEGNTIYNDERENRNIPLDNHYGIILMDGVWKFCLIKLGRRNTPDIQVKMSFSSKSEALEHLFLSCLYQYYLMQCVVPNRGRISGKWNFKIFKLVMEKLHIPERYLCTPESSRDRSICVFKKNGKWFESYIGANKEVFDPPKEKFDTDWSKDEDWFFTVLLNSVYGLYLLEKYTEELLEKKEINTPFTDNQITNFLWYST